MDILESSLRSRIPFVHVTTTDTVHVTKVLSYICGQDVRPFTGLPKTQANNPLEDLPGEVFFTNMEEPPEPKLWSMFRAANKTLVFVNTKKSVLQVDCGVLFPPKPLIKEFLTAMLGDEASAEELLHCFGGMTLKEIYEAVKICVKEFNGTVNSANLNSVRQSMISGVKGLTQVDTQQDFYDPPVALSTWMKKNLPFFMGPHDDLAPRGLLFDGPPGTGKSAAAKHIAADLGLPLYHIDLGSAKGRYVGDSEANLQAIIRQIDLMAPCVVLFDEVEKALKGHNGDNSGVTSSMLGALLWWLQEHKSKVFTLMTTNALDTLPKELYRPGRIDETMVFRGLESMKTATDFAKHALKVQLSKVFKDTPVTIPQEQLNGLLLWLDTQFKDTPHISQAEVLIRVRNIVKEVVASTVATA